MNLWGEMTDYDRITIVKIKPTDKRKLHYKLLDKNGDGSITKDEVLSFGMNINKSLLTVADALF